MSAETGNMNSFKIERSGRIAIAYEIPQPELDGDQKTFLQSMESDINDTSWSGSKLCYALYLVWRVKLVVCSITCLDEKHFIRGEPITIIAGGPDV